MQSSLLTVLFIVPTQLMISRVFSLGSQTSARSTIVESDIHILVSVIGLVGSWPTAHKIMSTHPPNLKASWSLGSMVLGNDRETNTLGQETAEDIVRIDS